MSVEMQRKMRIVVAGLVLGLGVLAAGCGHRPASPESVVALQPPVPATPGPSYRIQLGDEMHVRFLYQPEMDEQIPVRPDGRITLASTGELAVVGLTTNELEQMIVDRSSKRLRNPSVSVVMTKIGEQRVYVGGEVLHPGYVVIRTDGTMTPLQAILQSGGFKTTAKLDSVLLITPTPDGHFSAARMDLAQVVNDGVPERVRLHMNDVVFVPRTWIADMDLAVDQYVRGLIPSLPHVGAGYSLSQ